MTLYVKFQPGFFLTVFLQYGILFQFKGFFENRCNFRGCYKDGVGFPWNRIAQVTSMELRKVKRGRFAACQQQSGKQDIGISQSFVDIHAAVSTLKPFDGQVQGNVVI